MNGEPAANVYMSRKFMLDFTRRSSRKKWLKRRELEDMESDPSVVDMINAIQPLMGPLQAKLDKILYPNVADDVATVRELLSQYPGKPGLHALQNGPGFTRRNLWPAMTRLRRECLHSWPITRAPSELSGGVQHLPAANTPGVGRLARQPARDLTNRQKVAAARLRGSASVSAEVCRAQRAHARGSSDQCA